MHFCILLYLVDTFEAFLEKLLSTLFRREGNSPSRSGKRKNGGRGGEERWLMRLLTVAYIFPNE